MNDFFWQQPRIGPGALLLRKTSTGQCKLVLVLCHVFDELGHRAWRVLVNGRLSHRYLMNSVPDDVEYEVLVPGGEKL